MNRVRDKSTVRTFIGSEVIYEANGTISYGPTSYSSSAIQSDVMSDVVTPGFRKASALGSIIINPMTKLKVTRVVEQAGGSVRVFGGPVTTFHTFPPEIGVNQSPWLDPKVASKVLDLEGQAITQAFAQVGSPDVAVLTELAELKETLGFLASPVKAMVKLTRRFRRHLDVVSRMERSYKGRLLKWESLPPRIQARRKKPELPDYPSFKVGKWEGTDISSSWLAYRYGIMPLIYTFQDVEDLLKKRVEGVPIRATARSSMSTSVDLSGTTGSRYQSWRGTTYRLDRVNTGGCQINVRAGVLYNVDARLLTQLGIQWNRVPMALYEAIPLSFVSDWFHNGAEVYDALTAEFRSESILGSWVSTSIKFDVKYADVYFPHSPNGTANGQSSLVVQGTIKERKLSAVSDVKFTFRSDLNLKRAADGLALIHTLLATARKK